MANELVTQPRGELLSDEVLQPVMNLQVAKARLAEFQAFVKDYLKENEDFGTIPGTPKPTLLKPGADKLCELYGLSDAYEIVDKVEDFDALPPLFDYTIRCTLVRIRTQVAVASGLGSCSTYESKYKYRDSKRKCPTCGKDSILRSKNAGEGWFCWQKKGGCGAKFNENDSAIAKQLTGRIPNEDIVDQKNTVLKMAKKRAKIDATLSATRSSGVFTQDVEDIAAGAEYTPPAQDEAPTSTPSSTPSKGRAPARGKAPASESVICAECRATDSHAPTCSYHPKNKAQSAQPATQAAPQGAVVYEMTVEKVETGKTKGNRPYGRITCRDQNNTVTLVNVFHETPQKYMRLWVGKSCEMEITSKPSTANPGQMLYTLDKILRAGNVRYVDNAPSQDAPDASDLGFPEPEE